MSKGSGAADSSVLKQSRDKCWKARDEFFDCVKKQDPLYTTKAPVPRQCSKLRKAFENSCKASWVQHFDKLHDKQAALAQTLQRNINAASKDAAGALGGKPQS